VSRTSFSPADQQVREWLGRQCTSYGLTMHTDGIGNIILGLPQAAVPAASPVWAGSHLDSVPEGGRFDGIVGSIAALEALRVIAERGIPLQRPVQAVIFADEEGNYHHLLGSTAMVANYPWAELAQLRGRDGDRLVDALAGMGWDPAEATGTARQAGDVHAFLELHIEQGPVLEAAGVDIGIVTSIVGLGGGQVTFTGRQDHAGTTPMRQRLDPMPAAGAFLAQLPAIAAAAGDAAVLTCGLIEAEPGGTNVVPHQVTAHLDFRDPHPQALASLEQGIIEAASAAAEAHGVQSRYTRHSITRPVPLDPVLQDELHLSAKAQGLSTTTLPSGAGHDSQNMAQIAPTAMVFIPSRHGRSHSPAEHSSWAAIENGANVLLDVLLGLASAEAGRG